MTQLVAYLLLFLGVSVFFVFIHLVLGKMIRPSRPDADKLTIYECGEPTIGSAWIQFDLRYYVVALLFVIFDVEVAFFFPWAVVFGQASALAQENPAAIGTDAESAQVKMARRELLGGAPAPQTQEEKDSEKQAASRFTVIALCDILVFFGVLLVGFAYLWKRGDLSWVRSTAMERIVAASPYNNSAPVEDPARELVGAGEKLL
ncbi:MAG: NADH-quinone oxidoreductase subunit A [Gemmataceae bacterium]